jgi:hypothetical protein
MRRCAGSGSEGEELLRDREKSPAMYWARAMEFETLEAFAA